MKYFFIQTKMKKGVATLKWINKEGKEQWKISNWFTALRMLNGLRRKNTQFQYRLVSKRVGRFNKLIKK